MQAIINLCKLYKSLHSKLVLKLVLKMELFAVENQQILLRWTHLEKDWLLVWFDHSWFKCVSFEALIQQKMTSKPMFTQSMAKVSNSMLFLSTDDQYCRCGNSPVVCQKYDFHRNIDFQTSQNLDHSQIPAKKNSGQTIYQLWLYPSNHNFPLVLP
jgi:hypothetical protein